MECIGRWKECGYMYVPSYRFFVVWYPVSNWYYVYDTLAPSEVQTSCIDLVHNAIIMQCIMRIAYRTSKTLKRIAPDSECGWMRASVCHSVWHTDGASLHSLVHAHWYLCFQQNTRVNDDCAFPSLRSQHKTQTHWHMHTCMHAQRRTHPHWSIHAKYLWRWLSSHCWGTTIHLNIKEDIDTLVKYKLG